MTIYRALLVCCAFILGAIFNHASAQQPGPAPAPSAPEAATSESEPPVNPAATPGPTIYVVDNRTRLATLNLGTKAVQFIGCGTGVQLTDIAFNPIDHKLYGISFTALYSVSTSTGRATYIGSLGVSDANALVFNSFGVAYSAGVASGLLYKINLTTGKASTVGRMGGFCSLGDLAFYNGQLTLTGYYGCRGFSTYTPNYLVTLSETTGAVKGTPVLLSSNEVFGLVSTGPGALYGLGIISHNVAKPGLYQFVPTNPAGHRDFLLEDLTLTGLGQINGAAYDGNYQP